MDTTNSTFSPLKNNDIISILYKKYLGYANSNTTTRSNAEFPQSAAPLVFASKIATQIIPRINVPNARELINNTNGLGSDISTFFNNPVNVVNHLGQTVGKKYSWKINPHLVYYYNITLTHSSNDIAYYSRIETEESTLSNRIYNYYTSNIIPSNFTIDSSVYDIIVEYTDSSISVELPTSQYVLDRDAGLLTIYEEVTPKKITRTNLPRMSFWRYEGPTLDSFNASASLNYGNDTFLGNTLIEQPPAPIEKTPRIIPTNSEIIIRWTNPEQFNIGLICEKVPIINKMYITISDSSTPSNTYNIINGQTTLDYIPPSIIGLVIKNGQGSNSVVDRVISGQSEKIYEWYRNSDNINRVLVEPFTVNIWYENCSSKSAMKKLTIESLKYSEQDENPSPPTVSYTTEATSFNYSITKGQYTNILNTSDTTTQLIGYIIKYKGVQREVTDTKPKRRGTVDYLFPETTRFIEYTDTEPTIGTISNLYPGTSYEIELKAINSSGKQSSAITNRIELDLPDIGNTLHDFDLKSIIKTTGSTAHYPLDGYYNGENKGLILIQGQNAPNISDKGQIGPLRLMTKNTGGTKLADNTRSTTIKCSIDNPVDTQVSFEYKGFPSGQTGTVIYKNNDITQSNIIGNIIGQTSEIGNSIQRNDNFYTAGAFNICIKGSAYTAGSQQHTLYIEQSYDDDTQKDTIQLQFSVDNLLNNPIMNNYNYQLLSDNIVFVCGVPMTDGKWSINISNIQTENVVRYFHAENFITYSFTGKQGVILNSYAGTGNPNNTFITSTPIRITNTDTIDTFYYLPDLQVKAKTIWDNETSLINTIGLIVDNKSVQLALTLQNDIIPNNTPNNYSAGIRVETPSPPINTLENILKDYTSSKSIFNNTKFLTTDYKNELQIFDGRFITKAYTLDNAQYGYSSYTNLTSGPNYSGILASVNSNSVYRYATFRWSLITGKMNRLTFKIVGIKSSDLPLKQNSNSGLSTNSDKDIRLYYRIVDSTLVQSVYQEKDPQNVANPMMYDNFSTVWIDANSTNNQEHFGTLFGIKPVNTKWESQLGGLPDKNSLIINNNMANSTAEIEYNVRCNTIDLERTVYIYAMIGLPMDCPISFTGLRCNATYI